MKNQYTYAFKVRALRRFLSNGKSVRRTAAALHIPESTLVCWVSIGYEEIFRRYMDEVQDELDSISRLKARIATLETKNQMLGKMLATVARDLINTGGTG